MEHLTDHQLLQQLANIVKTYYECGGHSKAASNEALAEGYRSELINRGVTIPVLDDLLKFGVFNGVGAS